MDRIFPFVVSTQINNSIASIFKVILMLAISVIFLVAAKVNIARSSNEKVAQYNTVEFVASLGQSDTASVATFLRLSYHVLCIMCITGYKQVAFESQRGRGRQFGWFPADYVRLIPSVSSLDGATNSNAGIVGSSVQPVTSDLTAACSDSSSNAVTKIATASSVATSVRTSSLTTSPSSPTTKPAVELMQAIFSYKAAHADELTFDEGSIITVLGRDEPEWWRGRLHSSGLEGLFPVNYVRPYNSVVVNGGNAPKPLSYSVSSSQRDTGSLSGSKK